MLETVNRWSMFDNRMPLSVSDNWAIALLGNIGLMLHEEYLVLSRLLSQSKKQNTINSIPFIKRISKY